MVERQLQIGFGPAVRWPRKRLKEVLEFASSAGVLQRNLRGELGVSHAISQLDGQAMASIVPIDHDLFSTRCMMAGVQRRNNRGGSRSEERGYGRNVASSEIDDLDLEALEFAGNLKKSSREKPVAVDLGAGDGIGGTRFALMGLHTALYDFDFPDEILVSPSYPIIDRRFLTHDLATLPPSWLPSRIDLCYSHRSLHYLRPDRMAWLLSLVRQRCHSKARIFISVAGYDTEIGITHVMRGAPVSERFGNASPEMQEKHSIRHPLCIYRKQEFVDIIVSAGYREEKCWLSSFGNVKGIFSIA